MREFQIPNSIFEQMLQQAEAQAPIEACGILAGSGGKVKKLYRMTNADKSSAHFMMEPKEQFTVVKDIRAKGLEMLAIYHSHPATGARPSAEDVRLALTPDVTYIIVSLQGPRSAVVRGFHIKDSNITEVPIEITDH